MAGPSCERVLRCREKRQKRHLATAQGLLCRLADSVRIERTTWTWLTWALLVMGINGLGFLDRTVSNTSDEHLHIYDEPGTSRQPYLSNRRHRRDKSLMDFDPEFATTNRWHRRDRIRCKRSYSHYSRNRSDPVAVTLPFDKARIEALKGVYVMSLNCNMLSV
jgi:hypothetical protein